MMKRLPDGTPLLVRRIRPDDKDLLARGLAGLSDRTVQRRFLAPKKRFSQAELRYLTEIDHRNHVALAVESPAWPSRHLIAVGRFVRLSGDTAAADVAITVGDPWQGMGIGSMLARELATRARGLGIVRFTATMASDNVPARRLLHKLNADLHGGPVGQGVSELTLDLVA